MTLPPLPSPFGNPIFKGQAEIVAASDIDWLPQTPGWIIIGALLCGFIARLAWRKGKLWYRNRYRREALRRINDIAERTASEQLIAINETLKLAAMTASTRGEVASLAGEAWANWLNQRTAIPAFSANSMRALAHDIYQGADNAVNAALYQEARQWLKNHRDDHA